MTRFDLIWLVVIGALFAMFLAWALPAKAYDDFKWMLSFESSPGVDCLNSKQNDCAKTCHAALVSPIVADGLDVGSVVSVNGRLIVIAAAHPSEDAFGRSFVTLAGCVFKRVGS